MRTHISKYDTLEQRLSSFSLQECRCTAASGISAFFLYDPQSAKSLQGDSHTLTHRHTSSCMHQHPMADSQGSQGQRLKKRSDSRRF